MSAFNKIILLGNLTRDPQLSYTPNQTPVVDFGLATNRRWTGKNGEQREEVCFVDCRAFGRMAEILNQYLSKGSPIFIEGRLSFESWTAQDGTRRNKHRVTIESFQFISGNNPPDDNQDEQKEESEQPEAEQSDSNVSGDDIPF